MEIDYDGGNFDYDGGNFDYDVEMDGLTIGLGYSF